MKNIKITLLFVFLAGVLSTCKKYPEGPRISFWSKTWRLSGGWEVEAFLINGADSIPQLTCTSYYISKEEDSSPAGSGCMTGPRDASGDWKFNNHNKELNLNLDIAAGAKTPFPETKIMNSNLNWEIQRLTRKELWLKKNYNNKEYYIKFKATEKDFP